MIHFRYWCDRSKQGDGWDHFLQAADSYAAFAAKTRAEQPGVSVMSLVAQGLVGNMWRDKERYATPMTHWTGFHYLQGGHCWSHMDWRFNEEVATALDRGERVLLTSIPVNDMRGWYRCTLCGLVVHEPECPSCSMSCPVCEIIESEAAPADARWVSSNDYLRFGHSREYGQPYDEVDEGPGDETTTDNMNELVNRANKHTTISRCAVFLIKASRGEIDQTFRQLSKDRVVDRLNLGASEDELKDCALLHLEASTRCLDKVRSLTGAA